MKEQDRPICDYEGSDYQRRFWQHGNRQYEDRVEEIALRRLLPPGHGRLLEVGAGAGRNTLRYQGYRPIVLLDYSRTQLQQAIERLGRSDRYLYVAADAYRMPFAPGVFDAATMIRTLHHMADPLASLKQTRAALRSNGIFILEYANKLQLKAIARWFLRRQEWNPFDLQPVEFLRLHFDFHPRAIRNWLREANFDIQQQLTVSHFRLALLKRLLPLRLLVALDSLAQWTGNCWQLSPSVFVRSIAAGESETAPSDAFWRCPACFSFELEPIEEGLACQSCGRRWAHRDGIYDFKQPV